MQPPRYEDPIPPRTEPVAVRTGDDVARRSVAAPFLGLGGLILAISAFLSWASGEGEGQAAGGGDDSLSGYLFSDGRLVAGIGAALVLMALYMGTTRRYGHWLDADLTGVALSTIALTVIAATWMAIPEEEASPDIGLYVALAGALIAFGGSIFTLATGRGDPDADRRLTRSA